MKTNIKLIAVLFFVLNSICFAQWGGGLSLNLKNEWPQKGINFIVTHKLPFQWPLIGISVRFDAAYFKEKIPDVIERDLHLSLAGTLFYKDFQPYFAVGAGYAFHSANDVESNSFLFHEIAGVQLAVIKPVYPFVEIKLLQYLSELQQGRTNALSFQVIGAIGLKLEF
ncbi:MAG: hypothetical protein R6W90_03895 [Ignavibacteriaceae bacterium]